MSQVPVRGAAAASSTASSTRCASIPGVQNLQTDLRLNTPEVRVGINRDKLADVGVNVDTVGRTLETMLGGRQVTRFKRDGEQYDVIVQVAPLDRTTPADISDIYVRGRDGSMVQLANLVDVQAKASRRSRSTTSTGCARSRSPARSRRATRSTKR